MNKLIMVCGLPGSGKTTLAEELSKKLNIVCLHKDSIKENLYEILQLSTLEDSKKIGMQSVKLLLKLAEEQLKHNIDIIIESPFNFPDDYPFFQGWIDKYNLKLYTIICSIGNEERMRRFNKRDRHKSHYGAERGEDGVGENDYDYKNIPGKQIRIITDRPISELAEEIIKNINN